MKITHTTKIQMCLRAAMEVKTWRKVRKTRVKEGSESEQKQLTGPVTQHLCQLAGQQEKKKHFHPGNS